MQTRKLPDYYAVLGVEKTATDAEIKKAYNKLVLENHPDKGGDKDKFLEIQEAYEMLSDSSKREKYDNAVAGKAGAFADFDLTREDVLNAIMKHFESMFAGMKSHFEANLDPRGCMQPANVKRDMYYIVGDPLQLNQLVKKKKTLATLFKKVDQQYAYTKDFGTGELLKTLPEQGVVKVFLNKRDAQQYAHCLRQGLPHLQQAYFHGCVFGVQAKHDFNAEDLCFGRVVINEPVVKASVQVPYFEVHINDLIVATTDLRLPLSDAEYFKGQKMPDFGVGFIMGPGVDPQRVAASFKDLVSSSMSP